MVCDRWRRVEDRSCEDGGHHEMVMSFIGPTQNLRKFIASFSTVAALLHTITTNGKSFQWGKGQQRDFKEL